MPGVAEVTTKREPSHAIVAPVSFAPITVATPFRLVWAEKSSPVITLALPSIVMLKAPVVMTSHSAMACWPADSTPPFSRPAVAVFAQRPISRLAGCGDWLKYSAAARYSGAVVPKSSATSAICA